MSVPSRRLRVALVAGEPSGDQLGFKLMRALSEQTAGSVDFLGVDFLGVGGDAMAAEGLKSLFPLTDVAVMGLLPVIKRLPTLVDRIRRAAAAIVAARPDALVIIDSPDFTHRVARRVRRALPGLPVIDYVSPSVWAWRPGRARAMRAYVDCVLALLPFEPEAHARLGGPRCVYVGHPLVERLADLRPSEAEALRRAARPPLVLALPGSRRSVIARLMADFGAAIAAAEREGGPFEIVLPTLPHVESDVRALAARWPRPPRVVVGEQEKFAAFRSARAALAASGTVTLELALAGVPLVGAYKVSSFEALLRPLVTLPFSVLLPNLVLGEVAIGEFLQRDCRPQALATALAALVGDGPARSSQLAALDKLDARMRLADGRAPSAHAAAAVLETIARRASA
jgi:lipid-A-disaccharide synthase